MYIDVSVDVSSCDVCRIVYVQLKKENNVRTVYNISGICLTDFFFGGGIAGKGARVMNGTWAKEVQRGFC